MSIFNIFNSVSSEDKNEAIEVLIEHSTPRRDFFLMVVLAVLMAVFGIFLDNVVILIGSMLIAPVLYPVLTLALGITISDISLIKRSLFTLSKSILYALLVAVVVTLLLPYPDDISLAIITNENIVVFYAAVAIISGMAASFAMAKPHLNESFPGVAVSVSLVPPLALTGVALARFDIPIFKEALIIFGINILGIVFSSMIVFSLLNLSTKKQVAEEVLEKEERIIEEEKSE